MYHDVGENDHTQAITLADSRHLIDSEILLFLRADNVGSKHSEKRKIYFRNKDTQQMKI